LYEVDRLILTVDRRAANPYGGALVMGIAWNRRRIAFASMHMLRNRSGIWPFLATSRCDKRSKIEGGVG
jgi:hypothetical protein